MFKNRKRQMGNAAAAAMPMQNARPSERVVYTQPARPYASIIFALFACLVMLGPVIWFFGVFLLGQADYKEPERAMAEGLLLIMVGLPVLAYLTWLISGVLGKVLAHKEAMRQMDLEAMRYTTLAVGAPTQAAGRLTGEQKRLYENLALVMEQAYRDWVDSDETGYQGGSDTRPWSKRSVLAMEPPRYGRMPDSKATDIRKWLAQHEVIVGDPQNDQINIKKYPTLADFQALLNDKFNMPVVVQKALPSPAGSGYVPIDT